MTRGPVANGRWIVRMMEGGKGGKPIVMDNMQHGPGGWAIGRGRYGAMGDPNTGVLKSSPASVALTAVTRSGP